MRQLLFRERPLGDNIVGGVTIVVTAAVDPFVGMLAGLALKLLFSIGIGI